MFTDLRSVTYPPFIQTVGRFVHLRPPDPDAIRISLKAILAYEGRDDLGRIEQPTLVIGDDLDPYFSAPLQREIAEGIPDSSLALMPDAKHGAFHERKLTFDRRTMGFLAG